MITIYFLIGALWAISIPFMFEEVDGKEETVVDFIMSIIFWPVEIYFTVTQQDDDDDHG